VVKTIVVSLPFISFPFVWPPMWIFILKKHKKFHGCCGSDCQRLFLKELHCYGLWQACLIMITQSMLAGGMRVKDGSKDQKNQLAFLTWWSHW
jgi:hypothetical protein